MWKIVKNYRNNDSLRESFNQLAEKTFGLNFEDWYQNGFWGENYNPYSVVQDGKVIANVSVNQTNMMWNGKRKSLIQLGTVMTEPNYRNQGLIRKLMEEIEKDYADRTDGVYLFANDDVLDFYPKFGFQKAKEYQYSKTVLSDVLPTIQQIPMSQKKEWNQLKTAIDQSRCLGCFDMIENSGLYLFYVTKFMQENVYYDEKLDAYVIAEQEDTELFIHAVFSKREIELEDVIRAFGNSVNKVTLGFTPLDPSGYLCSEVRSEDTTLFIKGTVFMEFLNQHLMFPTLAHA